jgi:hypothetical protein
LTKCLIKLQQSPKVRMKGQSQYKSMNEELSELYIRGWRWGNSRTFQTPQRFLVIDFLITLFELFESVLSLIILNVFGHFMLFSKFVIIWWRNSTKTLNISVLTFCFLNWQNWVILWDSSNQNLSSQFFLLGCSFPNPYSSLTLLCLLPHWHSVYLETSSSIINPE